MLLYATFLVFYLLKTAETQCLIQNLDITTECFECDSAYYNNFSLPYQGGNISFPTSNCKLRKNTSSFEIFISPPGAIVNSSEDGSPVSPYSNLLKAFLEGWRRSNSFLSTNLSFKLYGNGLNGDQEDSFFFLNKLDFPSPYQYLFRAIATNIVLEPAYCNSTFNNSGCIKNPLIKPTIFWRCESIYIFITKSLKISNVIIDGRDMHLAQFINDSNKYSVFCSDFELQKLMKISENSFYCGRYNRLIDSKVQPYGIFNVEQLLYSNFSIEMPIFNLISSSIMNFLPIGRDYSIACFLRMQRLGFKIVIQSSIFDKNYFSEGIFSSKTDVPPIFYNLTGIYISFANDFELAPNSLEIVSSTISGYNFYQIFESEIKIVEKACILLNLKSPTKVNISYSIFLNNTVANYSSIRQGKFISYEFSMEILYFESNRTVFSDLIFKENTCKHFLWFKNVNYNFEGPIKLYKVTLEKNIDFTFYFESHFYQISLSINQLLITNQIIFSQPCFSFINVQTFYKLTKESNFINITVFSPNLPGNTQQPLFFLFNEMEFYSDETIFSISRNPKTMNIYKVVPLLVDKIVNFINSTMENISSSLFHFKDFGVIQTLIIKDCTIKNINIPQDSLISCSFEDSFTISNSNFSEIFSRILFDFRYGRDIYIENSKFSSIKASYLEITVWVGNIKEINFQVGKFYLSTLPDFLIINCYFKDNIVFGNGINTNQVLSKSVFNFTFFNLSLINIQGSYGFFFLKSYFLIGIFQNVSLNNISKISFISLDSYEDLIPSGQVLVTEYKMEGFGTQIREVFYDISLIPIPFEKLFFNNVSIFQGSQPAGTFLKLENFLYLSIENSNFSSNYFSLNPRITCVWLLSTFGSLLVSNSNFINLNSINCGALFLSVLKYENFSIINCNFINNTGNENAGDLMVKILSNIDEFLYFENISKHEFSDDFGIRYCSFSGSMGGLGGSISILDEGILFLKSCTFNMSSAKTGGAIYLDEKTIAYIYNSKFNNLKAIDSGGAIHSNSYYTLLSNIDSYNISASWGGFLYQDQGKIFIRNSRFGNCSGDQGGVIYLSFSEINMKNNYFHYNFANINGGTLFFQNCFVFLKNLTFDNSRSNYQGSSIFSGHTHMFIIYHITIVFCKSNEGSIYVSSSYLKKEFIIEDLNCTLNEVFNEFSTGACLLTQDVNIILKSAFITKNEAGKNLIDFSTKADSKCNSKLSDITISENNYFKAAIQASSIPVQLFNIIIKSVYFKNDLSTPTVLLFYFCKVKIQNLFFENKEKSEYLVTATDSSLDVSYLLVHMNNASFAFDLLNTEADLRHSSLIEGGLNNYASGIKAGKSDIRLLEVVLANCNGHQGGAIFLEESNLTVNNTIFLRNHARVDGSSILIKNSNFMILSNVTVLDSQGFSISITEAINVAVIHLIMKQSPGLINTQGIFFSNTKYVSIRESHLEGFHSHSSINITTTNRELNSLLLIIDTLFKNNFCLVSGGAISLDSPGLNANIIDCRFLYNSAIISGGAIHYKCTTQDCRLEIHSSIFNQNNGFQYSSAIKADHLEPILINNHFSRNRSNKTPEVILFPSKLLIFNGYSDEMSFIKELQKKGIADLSKESTNVLKNIASGRTINLICLVTDDRGNFFKNENDSIIKLISLNTSELNMENHTQFTKNGVAYFSYLLINAVPGKLHSLWVNYTNLNEGYYFNISIFVEVRPCIKGEILSGLKCKPCSEGFFSLNAAPDINTSCQLCPNGAKCPGGKIILPEKENWRKDENNSNITKCPNLGCEPDESHGKTFYELENYVFVQRCVNGNFGNLCYNCKSGFGRSSNKVCIECSESTYHFLRFIFLGFLAFLLLLYQSRSAFSITTIESKRRALIKILVDHVTYISLISQFEIKKSLGYIYDFFSINDQYTTAAPKEVFNFDCFFTKYVDEKDVFIWNGIIVTFSPFFYGITVLALLYIAYFFIFLSKKVLKLHSDELNHKISFQNNLLSISIIVFYNFYHRLLMNSLSFWKCLKIDDTDDSYLEANPDLKCWESLHLTYLLTISIPGLLIWALSGPLILLYITIRMSKKKSEATKKGIYNHILNFLAIDYVNQLYYWEFFTYISKFVIVFSILTASHLNSVSQGALVILIYLVFFLIHQAMRPYRYYFLNKLKSFSYLIAIATSAFAIMGTNKELNELEILLYTFCIFFANLVFYLVWGYLILENIKQEAMEIIKTIKEFIKSLILKRKDKIKKTTKLEYTKKATEVK